MKPAARTSIALVATAVLIGTSVGAWGESAIPDPPNFFSNLGVLNPQAAGTKVSGILTIVLDLAPASTVTLNPPAGPDGCEIAITNMSVVTSLEGPIISTPNGPTKFGIFSRDFTDHRRPGTRWPVGPFCLDRLDLQKDFVLALYAQEVIPYYFACDPDPDAVSNKCPAFQVKDIKHFFQSGRGGYGTEITLAVGGGN